ncbi:MAG: SPFH domain-containing protein [Oscillospiraceae bacterium]|nr:SPFH domain-containing protein [Oscillospiraceae bacterium]
MGLVYAALASANNVLSEQWKDYFYCDSLSVDVLAARGKKRTSGSSNVQDNVLTNGSVISVADGQVMMIVEQGKVVDLCAEPGEYVYDMSTEPSFFDGGKFVDNLKEIFLTIGKRFEFGGATPKDQRIYYFNTKEIVGNKYGTPSPVPFRVVDEKINLDVDIAVRCFGEYSYKLVNPILFYTNVCGNITGEYTRDQLDSQMKSELLTALQPAFASISDKGIRYSSLPAHTTELAEALKAELIAKWRDFRGIELQQIGVSSIKASEEDEERIKQLQLSAALKDPTLAGATLVNAQANAMQAAAENSGGAALGFMGYNMAQQAGGLNAQQLYQLGANAAPAAPVAQAGWNCPKCNTLNNGNFCTQCGEKRPEPAKRVKCAKCGWEPASQDQTPNFCPNCGDPIGPDDLV